MNAPLPIQNRIARSFVGLAIACVAVWDSGVAAQTTARAKSSVQPSSATSFPNWGLGPANAPVTLIEYASLTCGHCAQFNSDIMPTIKRLYIETGRIRYILKPLPTSPANLAIALHALTLCAGSSRYYPLADAFFERQRDIFEAASAETGPKSIIFAIAEDAGGLSNSASEACLRDPNRVAQVMASNRDGIAAGVTGTPTIFVNGVLVSVPPDQQQLQLATITQAIDAALRTASQRSVQPKSQSQSQSKAKKAKKR